MQLVQVGTIDLDKTVQQQLPKPLPSYPSYADLAGDPRYQKITPRMLLSHTSGFPNLRFLNPNGKLNINFEPGSRYAYSGEGMELLQLLVEEATKRPLQALMQERVFGPLGMTRTSMLTEARFDNDYANGYDEYGRSLGHQDRKKADAAGSMQTTLHDFTLFMQVMIDGNMIDGKGLRGSTRETMLSPQIEIFSKHEFPSLDTTKAADGNRGIRLSYGLGWGLYWSPYGKVFFKEGHDNGFRHYTAVFDERKDGMIIMTNSSNGEGIYKGLLESLLADTFTPIEWEGFTPYDKLPPRKPLPVHHEVTIDSKLLERLTGRYEAAFQGMTIPIVITASGGHLILTEGDEPPGELFAEGELQFFSKTSDDVITFDLDGAGKPVRLVVHTGGREVPVPRAK